MIVLLLASAAWAGWTVTVEDGTATAAEVAALERFITHCPARQEDWMARFTPGKAPKLGPVGGAPDGAADAQGCLEAGLKAAPVAGPAMLRLRWQDPVADRWLAQVSGSLNQLIGPSSTTGCVVLVFPVDSQGKLGAPVVGLSSGDPAFDQKVLTTVKASPVPIPPVPEQARARLGDRVGMCLTGVLR